MPADRKYNEYDNFAFHPYNVLLVLLLMGLTALFLAMTASFLYTRVQAGLPPLKIPAIFLLNTLLLVASSGALAWAKRSYLADHTLDYQRALGLTILLSLLFLVLQGLGWKQLLSQNVHFLKDNSASYLYLISGLHFAHVVAGLPFLVAFLQTARIRMVDPVSVLVYFSDPAKRLKLRLLTLYWHFLDGLWIYLVLFFWFNSLWRA
ncbi:MAG: cytochrome c oxidase subunit 3 [Saprospirales bacterium]|nr:cytochrome c oxidase subunit 3 [Saprospirales bacterium]